MTAPENPKPPTHKGRAAGLEMLGLGLIAIGTMMALAALAGGPARQIAGGIGLPLIFFGILVRRRSNALFWASSDRCPGCGHDLSLSPKRCPTCGMERSAWPQLDQRPSSPLLVTLLVFFFALAIAAGVVLYNYSHIAAVRGASLWILVLAFAGSAFCFFSLPSPKG